MQAFADYIKKHDPSTNVIYIDYTKLSFEHLKEYHALNSHVKKNTQAGVANYLMVDEVQLCPNFEGGMPGSYVYSETTDKENYVREVFNTILTRDLTEKYKIVDTQALSHLAEYLMDNVSNTTSPNSVANMLTTNKVPTTHVTVSRYLKMLCQAFVFYKADRYDIRGKKYLESLNKYYLSDTSIRYALLGHRNMDCGRIYENIVYIELLRRNYRVYTGKLYNKVIDFVAMLGNEKFYIQVSDDISTTDTLEREVTPLLAIKDAYPKILLARTRHEEYDYQGIRLIDIATWLFE